jgi:hypothetical protein
VLIKVEWTGRLQQSSDVPHLASMRTPPDWSANTDDSTGKRPRMTRRAPPSASENEAFDQWTTPIQLVNGCSRPVDCDNSLRALAQSTARLRSFTL